MKEILHVSNINKSYAGIRVLTDVEVSLCAGEVVCLVGENGAGKSTLIKILSGAEVPDSGSIKIFDKKYECLFPKQAMNLGIATIYQDADLVDSLTVSDNIFLGNERLKNGLFIKKSDQEHITETLLKRLHMDIMPSMLVEKLSPGQKQNLQIAKALHRDAKILIMDEPTASLGEEETAALMELVEELRSQGIGIIYISHYLEEVFRLGDRAFILKDGHLAGQMSLKEVTQKDLIRAMVGRDASNFYKKGKFSKDDHALSVERFSGKSFVEDISFTVSHGEVLGLGGLVGAGRTELVRMLYGADHAKCGRLILEGKDITAENPKDAIKKGIVLISEDRKAEGLFMIRSVRENLTISYNDNLLFINRTKENDAVSDSIASLAIKVFGPEQEVCTLSGGNQQKVVIAKWLLEDAEVYIFDEPSKGVDIGAREEIYRLIEKLAKKGKIIIMISSNMPELLSMSDRIAIMRDGKLIKIVDAEAATEDSLIKEYIGVEESAS